MKKLTIIFAAALLMAGNVFGQKTWNIDASHSNIGFVVTHMVISEVEGSFDEFDGSLVESEKGLEDAQINFKAQIASIDTDNEKRDGHLASADFFDAEKYPEMTFKSTSFTHTDGKNYKLKGDMTMKGVTKPVELDVRFNGTVKDGWGNERAGFKITGEINRFDFGLNWNAALETGGLVVSEEVIFDINIELIAQKETTR
jgi:polyisoprenoid-binding protein YceI